jgi:hypothetical protein
MQRLKLSKRPYKVSPIRQVITKQQALIFLLRSWSEGY